MSFPFGTCTEEQLWHLVATHLQTAGIDVILVGGAVAAIYSEGLYTSGDLDFLRVTPDGVPVADCMLELGFRFTSGHFEHPDCPHLFVEFVQGPLGIGADTAIVPAETTREGHKLKILSPTDCVRDRLASYIHYGARECLDQAVMVAKAKTIDWELVERWCLEESAEGAAVFSDLRRLAK